MTTSVFKSTTKRSSFVGGGANGGAGSDGPDSVLTPSSNKAAHRRSSSLSRFSRHEHSNLVGSQAADYTVAPRGKFVNTVRGSEQWPEISLDDLAVEFFSSSSFTNDEEVRRESGERGRSRSSRRATGGSKIGRWAGETASSRRRGRSTSRHGAVDGEMKTVVSNGISGRNKDSEASSRRRRSISVSRQDNGIGNSGFSGGTSGKMINSDANSRRRRSFSVARHQISDSESDADHIYSVNSIEGKKIHKVNGPTRSSRMTKTSGEPLLRKSVSQIDLNRLYDGYSSHSSILTDDDTKDARGWRNGNEKTIHAVYAQKRDVHPKEDAMNSELHEAMREEIQNAVQEIRGGLEHVIVRNDADRSDHVLQPDEASKLQAFSAIRKDYATKLEQSHQRKQDLLTEMMLEEHRGKELDKIVRDLLPYSNNSAAVQQPTTAIKRSTDKIRMSKQLSEEAERFLEDFLSNAEDTDISSFDGERSDSSSTIGRPVKPRDPACVLIDSAKNPAGFNHKAVGMDGVILPWLQWETNNDGFLSNKNRSRTPVIPKTLHWNTEQDIPLNQDPSGYSISSHGSWNPELNGQSSISKEDKAKKYLNSGECQKHSTFDMSQYVVPQNEVLFELFKERNRINSGGLLLCTHIF